MKNHNPIRGIMKMTMVAVPNFKCMFKFRYSIKVWNKFKN